MTPANLCKRLMETVFFLLLLSSPVIADVSEQINYITYTAGHQAGETLLQTLNSSSPIRHNGGIFHGYTSWHIEWQYEWSSDSDGYCYIARNKTTLTAAVTLPRLVSSDSKIKAEFSKYLDALRIHETGHLKIARETAEKIDSDILSLTPMNSCRLLEETANQKGYHILEEARQQERNYDQSTNYGVTQGAFLR